MKILFILPSLVMGGMERMQAVIANALVRKGYDVTVMTLEDRLDLKDEFDDRVRIVCRAPKRHLGGRLPYIRHKLYDDGMWETRATPRQLYRYYVGDERYDVLIAFFKGLPVKIVSGCPDGAVRRIAWIHNDYTRSAGISNNFRSLSAAKAAYRTFDSVVCVSEQARQGFLQVMGDAGNTVTIYNMIPAERICRLSRQPSGLLSSGAAFNAVVVGRLCDEHKGQLRLIRVVSRLHDEGVDLSLTIVGDGQDGEKLRALIEERGASDYIRMTGTLSNPYPVIRAADLLVCASYYEGYNLTVAEALVLGTPVLSTACTGPNEILDGGKYGMIVDNSEEGLYQGLKSLCEDPGLLEEYRKRTAKRQAFFDEERILQQITDLFE